MPVEIVILSGARQGTRQVLDRSEFRVGCQPACDVRFDPQQDRSAVDREALFRLTDEGWTVSSTGLGEVFLNKQLLLRNQRIRSGDVLRMSNQGPDLAFNILLRAPAAAPDAGAAAGRTEAPAMVLGDRPSLGAPQATVFPGRNGGLLPSAVSAAASADEGLPVRDHPGAVPQADTDRAAAAVLPPPAGRRMLVSLGQRGRMSRGLVGLGLLVVIVLLLAQWRRGQTPNPAPASAVFEKPPAAAPAPPPAAAPAPPPAAHPATGSPPAITAQAAVPDTRDRPSDSPPPPAPSLADRLQGTVFLIELEHTRRRMPFANGVAVGERLVLTCAKQAMQLARWRKQGVAERIWVVDRAAEVQAEVQDIRVLADCATIPADSPNWIYCNLALLTVATKLPKHVALAAPPDLEKLKEGATVYCLGTPHEGVPLSDPDELRPQLKKCRLHFVTVARELSSQPRLLHLKAELPANLFGSPVVNKEGQLVGVYGHAAVAPEQGATPEVLEMVKNLHYALAVGATVSQGGLTASPGAPWVTAESVPPPPSEARR